VSIVVFKRVTPVTREGVERAVRAVVEPVAPTEEQLGADVLVKLNAMSDEVFPGRNTSPWVLDAVLATLRERYPRARFTIIDTDVAGARQFDRAFKNWGYDAIARRHEVAVRNVSNEPTVRVQTSNPRGPEIDLPRLLTEASAIVNLPVLKTHVLSGITCALKNHWGLLPRVRYQFHPVLHEVIAEINHQIRNTILNIVDGTICIEGSGPKIGVPRVANVLFASRDRVAVDSAALDFIGMDPKLAPHVARAEELGVGSTHFEMVGDPYTRDSFELPRQSQDVVSWLETRIRGLPLVGPVFYWPPISRVLGRIGTEYNKRIWMNLHGRKHVAAICRHPEYGAQFASLNQ
jgi:uncharacterized protein (DUF362 family)